jgi:DNA repair protein RadC
MSVHTGHRQRKKDLFLQQGPDGFADHELLEMLLFYAIPRRDTNELAHSLLEQYGTLNAIWSASPEELERFPGVGHNTAVLLKLAPAVCRRNTADKAVILNSVNKVGAFFVQKFGDGDTFETLYQACLDRKGRLLACKNVSKGSSNSAAVSVRTIVQNALSTGASGVILAHNHPSGVALPSREDVAMTLQTRDALRVVEVELVDHVVVADGDFVSMAENGTLL